MRACRSKSGWPKRPHPRDGDNWAAHLVVLGANVQPFKLTTHRSSSRARLALISLVAGMITLAACAPAGPTGPPEGNAPAASKSPRTLTLSGRLESVNGLAVFS